MQTEPSILVTGAGGALGRLVLADLAAAGRRPIAGTRDPWKIAHRLPARVPARRIDFDDPASLRSGLQGIDRLLIVSTDELATPGKRQRQHRAVLDAARAASVSFIAYTSMPDPFHSPAIPFAPDHAAMERDLRQSGIPHAILRNGWYQENLLGTLPRIIADGVWFTTAGSGRLPYVARADAATAAAASLANAAPGLFDIAGPEPLTVEDIAKSVRDTLNRPLTIVQVDDDRLAAELARQGVPAFLIPMVTATEAHQRTGGFDIEPNDVQRLTGRPSRALADFLRAHAGELLSHSN